MAIAAVVAIFLAMPTESHDDGSPNTASVQSPVPIADAPLNEDPESNVVARLTYAVGCQWTQGGGSKEKLGAIFRPAIDLL